MISLGWYVKRTYVDPVPRGKTIVAPKHILYPTREDAEAALRGAQYLDHQKFEYTVAEVFTRE